MAGTINAANISIGFDGSKLKAGEELTRSSINTIRQNMSRSMSDQERYRAEMNQLEIAFKSGAIEQHRYGQATEYVAKKYGVITPLMEKKIEADKREAELLQRKMATQKREAEELQRHITLTRSVETASERHTRQMREYHAELRKGVIDHETYNRLLRQSTKEMNARGGVFGDSKVGGIAVGSMVGNAASNVGFSLLGSLKAQATDVFELAAKVESATVSFEVLTQSASKAKKMVDELRQLDKQSLLSFVDLAGGAKTMMGYGVAANQVASNLEALSKVSMGNADAFQRLNLAFSQTMAKGKLAGEEVRQMINAGFNPLQAIAQKMAREFGGPVEEHMTQLQKRMEEGAVSSRLLVDALQDISSESGRLGAMNEKMLTTVEGKWNKLGSEFQSFKTRLGQFLEPLTKQVLDFASANAKAAGNNMFTAGVGGLYGAGALFGQEKAAPMQDDVTKFEKEKQLSREEMDKILKQQMELARIEKEIADHKTRTISELAKSNHLLRKEELNTIEIQLEKMKELKDEEIRRRGSRSPDLVKIEEAIASLTKANNENIAQKEAEKREKDNEFNRRAKQEQDEIRAKAMEKVAQENASFQKRMKESTNPDNLSDRIAPSVKAGTAEAYKFLIDRQEKIGSRTEQIAAESKEHLSRLVSINEDMRRDLERAPRIVKVG